MSEKDIDKCMMCLAMRISDGILKDKWSCVLWCMGYFYDVDAIPISILKYINDLYCADIIK